MKKLFLIALTTVFALTSVKADEGMWLLTALNKNEKQMKQLGLKLSQEEIYSVNKSSLKDAIIIFGGGCTGEIVSSEGLIFTNHHCGYSAVQSLSSMEHNWLQNGFWASSHEEELPAGLKVTFIRQIIDVTDLVQDEKTTEELEKQYSDPEKNLTASIVPMFEGNQYILFVKETFGDVRLVGVPPENIGKYGGDTDNWMWPRHTGDFSIFRVYADQNNNSTKGYNKDNVPYKPISHLTVSTKGYQKGDFAMIMGFPGSTTRYMTTWEIDSQLNIENPIRIFVRGEKQDIWWNDMMSDPAIRLKYANKYASSSNYWKNSIGMSKGIRKLKVKERMQERQNAFTTWVNASPERGLIYGDALTLIEKGQKTLDPFTRKSMLISECMSGMEIFRSVGYALRVKDITALKNIGKNFFKNYNLPTDRKATEKMIRILSDSLSAEELPDFINENKGNLTEFLDYVFSHSALTDSVKFRQMTEKENFVELFRNDTITKLIAQFKPVKMDSTIIEAIKNIDLGRHLYVKGLLEMYEGHNMYPDANFTIRLTYGSVEPYKPADAVFYDYYTTLEGVIAKEDKNNPEFELEPKLKELLDNHNYGRWADKDGTIHVNFLSTNDITGGNSGSPVLNAKGELIGLAFDGNWEAMSGDVVFEPELQRTISLDVRYLLFIVDRFAGAQNIIDELTLN